MKSRFKGVVLIGLGISLLIAIFFSPFASSAPDGLEKVAALKGFSQKAEGPKSWRFAPLANYTFPWVKNVQFSTALSGLMGTLAIFFIVMGLGRLLKRSTTTD
jgi:cobalt/nickel transport protein